VPRSSRIFRLFVSSTFTDLKHERTALQRHVFPHLEELCKQYGAKFQAIDLRWGVSTEAQLDHKTLDICLNELRRCKELSPKPNFLILLGNRYGWRPVPNTIEKSEFEMIRAYVKGRNQKWHELLASWYEEDQNQLPASYILLPRTGGYENPDAWRPVEECLRVIFDEAVENLPFTDEQRNKYILSATEHEIREGAFAQEDASDHVFAFFREFEEMPLSSKAGEYLDLRPDDTVDTANQKMLEKLKQDIEAFLPEENITRKTVDWNGEGPDLSYLPDFYKSILTKLEEVIKRECQDIMEFSFADKEQQIHRQFARNHSRHFIGREKEIAKVKAMLGGSRNPIVLCGESGAGKTALAAALSTRMMTDRLDEFTIHRFIGASSFGMNTVELLQSIISELDPDQEETVLEISDLDDLLNKLSMIFHKKKDKRYNLIIDAIDQLQDRQLVPVFLQQTFPAHVSVIMTVAMDSPVYSTLTGILPDDHFIVIEEMNESEGKQLLRQWLSRENRTLQPDQEEAVLSAFKACPLPLYLKLAFEEVKGWTSFQLNPVLLPSIEGIIQQFFERLSHPSRHGRLIVENVFGLLAASRNGLEETELIDLLSNNPEVMEDFYKNAKHDYLDKKLPVVLWARLFNDLEPYLMEKADNGSYLYGFYHRQIENKVKDQYLKLRFHQDMVDYFDDLPNFVDGESMRISNIRRSYELPYQIYHAGSAMKLENLLADFSFLHAKLAGGFSHDLLHDYRNLKEILKAENASMKYAEDFERFCRIRHALLVQYPDQILSFALGMPEESHVYRESKRWHEERDIPYIIGQEMSDQDRCIHIFQLPESDLSSCKWHPDGNHLLTIHHEVIKGWDIHTGEEGFQIQPRMGEILSINFSADNELLTVNSKNKVKVLKLPAFHTVYEAVTETEEITDNAMNPAGEVLAIGCKSGWTELHNLRTGDIKRKKIHDEPVLKVAWRLDGDELALWYGNELFGANYRKLFIMDPVNQSIKKVLRSKFQTGAGTITESICLQYDDSGRYITASENESIMIWDVQKGIRENSTVNLEKGRHIVDQDSIFSILDSREIHIWNKTSGDSLLRIQLPPAQMIRDVDFQAGILAVVTVEGKVAIWDFRHIEQNVLASSAVEWTTDHPMWVFGHYLQGFRKGIQSVYSLGSKKKLTDQMEERMNAHSTGSKDLFRSIVVSVSLSKDGQHLATGSLDQYLQINHWANDSVIRFQPFNTGTVLFCDWSYDQKWMAFGTERNGWVIGSHSGYIKWSFSSESGLASISWSPVGNLLAVLHSNGQVDIHELHGDLDVSLRLEGDRDGNEGALMARWSSDGKHFAVCRGRDFHIFRVGVQIDQVRLDLVSKATLSQNTVNFEWSPDSSHIAFFSDQYELMIIHLKEKKIIMQQRLFAKPPSESLIGLMNQIMLKPQEKIAKMEALVEGKNGKRGGEVIDSLAQILGSSVMISWHSSGSVGAVAIGYWMKLFYIGEARDTALCYTDEPILHLSWSEDQIMTVESNALHRKEYRVSKIEKGVS